MLSGFWRRRLTGLLLMAASLSLVGCAEDLPLTLQNIGKAKTDAPAGPTVADLVNNLTCEMKVAANSTNLLPYYKDGVEVDQTGVDGARAFKLINIFSEIEYVGVATYTLDVTHTDGFNPSMSLAKYYSGSVGDLPATGALLSVGGTLSDAGHRFITFSTDMDMARFNESVFVPFPRITRPVPLIEDSADVKPENCDKGMELGGQLGLKEVLATGLIAAAMNNANDLDKQALDQGITNTAAGPPISVPSTASFGQISTQIDFTIIEGVSGGPNWTLNYFKGPNAGNSSLLSFQRQVKDTLVATFVPVCIRQRYWTDSMAPPYEYVPKPVVGSPPWMNFLPPCGGVDDTQLRSAALGQAASANIAIYQRNTVSQ